jgi:uncharacterized protein (UPF0332 family)
VQPLDLLETAEVLLNTGPSKLKDANLRRAQSSVYYALFHTLARTCADLLIGGTKAKRSKEAWQQTYRALGHNAAKTACSHGKISKFPDPVRDFANQFVAMQKKRHSADYDPFASFAKSTVKADIAVARQAIHDFKAASPKDRRAFCAFVLFKRYDD